MIPSDINLKILSDSLPYDFILIDKQFNIIYSNSNIPFLNQNNNTSNIKNIFSKSNSILLFNEVSKVSNSFDTESFIIKEIFNSDYLYIQNNMDRVDKFHFHKEIFGYDMDINHKYFPVKN